MKIISWRRFDGALFTKTPQKFDTLFQGVKCIN